jgi:hypothetical protein
VSDRSVIRLSVACIMRERDGGWLVVAPNGHAWLHGSREEALKEAGWLDRQYNLRSTAFRARNLSFQRRGCR